MLTYCLYGKLLLFAVLTGHHIIVTPSFLQNTNDGNDNLFSQLKVNSFGTIP